MVFYPSTTRSDRYVDSPHNFNEISIRQVLRIKTIIGLNGVIFLKYQILMTTQLVKRMIVSIVAKLRERSENFSTSRAYHSGPKLSGPTIGLLAPGAYFSEPSSACVV